MVVSSAMIAGSFTSTLPGIVGVGNAVRAFLEQRSPTIATLKCLGAPSRLIFQTYLAQILALAVIGVVICMSHMSASQFWVRLHHLWM